MPLKKRKMPERSLGKFKKRTSEPIPLAKSAVPPSVNLPTIVVTPVVHDIDAPACQNTHDHAFEADWIFLDDQNDDDFIFNDEALDEEDKVQAVPQAPVEFLQPSKPKPDQRSFYASSFTSNAKSNVNDRKRKQRETEAYEKEKGIPHRQSKLASAPMTKLPAQIIAPEVATAAPIELVEESSDKESESVQTPQVSDQYTQLDGTYHELVEDCIQAQEVTVAGGTGTVAVELDLEAYAGTMDNDIGENDEDEEDAVTEGSEEVYVKDEEGEQQCIGDSAALEDEELNDTAMLNMVPPTQSLSITDDITSAALGDPHPLRITAVRRRPAHRSTAQCIGSRLSQ